MNIRARLTLQFILLTAGIFLTALLFIHRQFEQHVEAEFFALLESKARMTGEMVLSHEEDLSPITLPPEGAALPSTGNTAIFDKQFQCVFSLNRSERFLDDETLEKLQESGGGRLKCMDFFVFGTTLVTNLGNSYLVLTKDIPDYSKLQKLRNILLVSFFLIIAAVAAGGWFYAGQALRPVSRIVEAVDEILPTDLSRRLQADNQHDEISHLVKTFNRLLDRIEHAFRMQRSFISNVSHELKNPLAAMDAQLQLARAKTRSPEEYGSVIDSIHDDVQELSDTTAKLLQLAKVNSDPQGIRFAEVRLDELLYQARSAVLKTYPEASVLIEITDLPENEDQLCVEGNEPLLRTALLNLLGNGCKFSRDNRVEASIGFNKNGLPEIRIFNEGNGIPAEELPRIFEPFFRSSKDISKKGSGIGLSLVQSILQLHGVELSVSSSTEKGTLFLLIFSKTKSPQPVFVENAAPTEALLFEKNDPKPVSFLKKMAQSIFVFGLIGILVSGCGKAVPVEKAEFQQAKAVLKNYNQTLLEFVRNCEGYRPPVSARMYAYMGIAAWESSRPALPDARSIVSVCPGLQLPVWDGRADEFVLPIALESCYRAMTKRSFPHRLLFDSEKKLEQFRQELVVKNQHLGQAAIEKSTKFGQMIAAAVYDWSATDSIGHQSYLFNYDKNYVPPSDKGCWQPSGENPMPALLPKWGQARTFIVAPGEVEARPPLAFSEERNSPFFAQAMELYTLSRPISDENRWIAEFWSDDFAGISFCAASRQMSIASQAIAKEATPFPAALEIYLKLGLALNDAAVKVWAVKYQFNIERPETYIKRNITTNWDPLHPAPPFPAYPSGHASFGNAAAAVFSSILGDSIEFSDRSHDGRKEFLGKPRQFHSFHEMAQENAVSRLFGGVHFRMDCEEGYRLGGIVGEKVVALDLWESGKWTKD